MHRPHTFAFGVSLICAALLGGVPAHAYDCTAIDTAVNNKLTSLTGQMSEPARTWASGTTAVDGSTGGGPSPSGGSGSVAEASNLGNLSCMQQINALIDTFNSSVMSGSMSGIGGAAAMNVAQRALQQGLSQLVQKGCGSYDNLMRSVNNNQNNILNSIPNSGWSTPPYKLLGGS